jgi:hypothetical protein
VVFPGIGRSNNAALRSPPQAADRIIQPPSVVLSAGHSRDRVSFTIGDMIRTFRSPAHQGDDTQQWSWHRLPKENEAAVAVALLDLGTAFYLESTCKSLEFKTSHTPYEHLTMDFPISLECNGYRAGWRCTSSVRGGVAAVTFPDSAANGSRVV